MTIYYDSGSSFYFLSHLYGDIILGFPYDFSVGNVSMLWQPNIPVLRLGYIMHTGSLFWVNIYGVDYDIFSGK